MERLPVRTHIPTPTQMRSEQNTWIWRLTHWSDHRATGPVAFMIVIKNGTIAISVMTAMAANAATYFNKEPSAFFGDFCLCLFALDMDSSN